MKASGRLVDAGEIGSEFWDVQTIFRDRQYIRLDHTWLVVNFLNVFWSAWLIELGATYRSECWDCDKYALSLQAQMQIAAFKARAAHTAAFAFLGVNDNGGHALNLALTDRGWFEIEPQTNEIRPLRSNHKSIRHAIF